MSDQTNPFTEPLATGAAGDSASPAPTGPPTGNAANAPDMSAAVAKRNAAASAGYGAVSASAGADGQDAGAYTRPDPEVDGPGGASFGGNSARPTGGDAASALADTKEPAAAAAASDDRLVNVLFVVLSFLAWVGCWVVFTGRMNYLYFPGSPSAKCQFYWNRGECSTTQDNEPSIHFQFSECINLLGWRGMTDICSKCHSSGQGSLAMAVFAFFALTLLLVLVVARVVGRSASIPWFGADSGRYHKTESVLTGISFVCFAIIVMLWRTKCMEEAQDWNHFDESVVVGSGWWYCVAVFFFLLVALVLSLSYSTNPFCRNRCHDTLSEQASVTQAARAGADPTCLTGFQNSPAFATRCDAVLNVAILVCGLLCWIGTLVALGGELHRMTLQTHPGGTLSFGWKSFSFTSTNVHDTGSYDECTANGIQILTKDQCDSCLTGGRGTVAVAALGFIAETLALIFILLRMSGKVKAKLLRGEYVLAIFAAIMLLFVSVVWGGTCFNSMRQGLVAGLDFKIIGTGWAYDVFCFLLSTVVVFLLWIVRHRAGDLPSLETGGVYAGLRSEV